MLFCCFISYEKIKAQCLLTHVIFLRETTWLTICKLPKADEACVSDIRVPSKNNFFLFNIFVSAVLEDCFKCQSDYDFVTYNNKGVEIKVDWLGEGIKSFAYP